MHGIRHHHGGSRLWFDLSEVPGQSAVISSELRLFLNRSLAEEFADENEEYEPAGDYSISLYEIGKENSLFYVDRIEVNGRQEGWTAFNVTLVLHHWLLNPQENFGLEFVCRLASSGIYS